MHTPRYHHPRQLQQQHHHHHHPRQFQPSHYGPQQSPRHYALQQPMPPRYYGPRPPMPPRHYGPQQQMPPHHYGPQHPMSCHYGPQQPPMPQNCQEGYGSLSPSYLSAPMPPSHPFPVRHQYDQHYPHHPQHPPHPPHQQWWPQRQRGHWDHHQGGWHRGRRPPSPHIHPERGPYDKGNTEKEHRAPRRSDSSASGRSLSTNSSGTGGPDQQERERQPEEDREPNKDLQSDDVYPAGPPPPAAAGPASPDNAFLATQTPSLSPTSPGTTTTTATAPAAAPAPKPALESPQPTPTEDTRATVAVEEKQRLRAPEPAAPLLPEELARQQQALLHIFSFAPLPPSPSRAPPVKWDPHRPAEAWAGLVLAPPEGVQMVLVEAEWERVPKAAVAGAAVVVEEDEDEESTGCDMGVLGLEEQPSELTLVAAVDEDGDVLMEWNSEEGV